MKGSRGATFQPTPGANLQLAAPLELKKPVGGLGAAWSCPMPGAPSGVQGPGRLAQAGAGNKGLFFRI